MVAALGCTPSVLVRPDDAMFAGAQEHIAIVGAMLEKSEAEPDEKQRFAQAEAFYEYRFTFPKRGASSQLAEAAAVVIELPALQAMAGALDLLDLRLRSYDAAVQLWESLLANRPRTRLRPLALYQLGWAYRSAGVSGLPRATGDEAFDVLIRDHPTSPLAPLARAAKTVPWKSKRSATSLSLVPGLGHIYVGEHLSGSVRLAVAIVSAVAIIIPSVIAYERRSDLSWQRDWPLLATGIGGVIVLSIDYTISYQDALRGVVQFNERAEDAFHTRYPQAP